QTRYYILSSRRRHTRFSRDWSSDVCSSDLAQFLDFDFRQFLHLAVGRGVLENLLAAGDLALQGRQGRVGFGLLTQRPALALVLREEFAVRVDLGVFDQLAEFVIPLGPLIEHVNHFTTSLQVRSALRTVP